jgi:hypothetical protein
MVLWYCGILQIQQPEHLISAPWPGEDTAFEAAAFIVAPSHGRVPVVIQDGRSLVPEDKMRRMSYVYAQWRVRPGMRTDLLPLLAILDFSLDHATAR